MADNFAIKDPAAFRDLKKLCYAAKNIIRQDPDITYEMLTWPIRARRESFELLNFKGAFGTAAYGVNNFVSKICQERTGKDLSFEFMVSADNIHLAHALNATYYPYRETNGFSDCAFTQFMSIYLNIFKLSTPQHLSLLSKGTENAPAIQIPLNPIDIIDVDTYVPIMEYETILEESGFYPGGKRLMEALSTLSNDERKRKIDSYNQLVTKELQKKNRKSSQIDLLTNAALDGIGLSGIPFLGTAYFLFQKSRQKFKTEIKELQNLFNPSGQKATVDIDKANIHFLTRINRVAGLKRFK